MNSQKAEFSRSDTKAMKGIAIILMMYHHLFAFPENLKDGCTYISLLHGKQYELAYVIGALGKLCVPLFVMLGGYGIYKSLAGSSDIGDGIIKRIKGLYIQYWKVFFIFVPIGFLLGCETVPFDIHKILLNVTAIDPSFNGSWWFLPLYIVLLLLTPALIRWIDRKGANLPAEIIVIISVAAIGDYVLPQIWNLPLFSNLGITIYGGRVTVVAKYLPCFMLGLVAAKYDLVVKWTNIWRNRLMDTVFSLVVILSVFYLRWFRGDSWDYAYCLVLICAFNTFLKSVGLGTYLQDILVKLGNYSTGIWFIHSFWCIYYWQKLVYFPKISFLIVIWLLVLSYLSAWGIEKLYNLLGNGIRKFEKREAE